MAQLKQLETTEQRIANLDKKGKAALEVLLTTKTISEAAEKLKISRTTLYTYIEKYELDNIILGLKNMTVTTLAQASIEAAENLAKKINSKDEEVSLKASTEILDRIGITKPQVKAGEVNINFNNHAATQREQYSLS